MKILSGAELALFIKERQAKQVRGLRQANHVFPRLIIITTGSNPVIDTYVRLKKSYAEDILIDVEERNVPTSEVARLLEELNQDVNVHGIILQLPLEDESQTDALVELIAPEKDVDNLGGSDTHIAATAMAIDWLIAGYNVQIKDKKIAIVGNGRLVGAPLYKLWSTAGHDVSVYDDTVENLSEKVRSSNIIVSATGVPGLITSAMVASGSTVIDAGTASEGGVMVGDVAANVHERKDIDITPMKGGVGPLTIAALFDNVIIAARNTVPPQS